MCWNEQVSFLTYVVVIIIIVIILRQNPSPNVRWQAYFALTFITIQLLEGFLWVSIKNKNDQMNAFFTRLVLIALWAQPLINSYAGARFGQTSDFGKKVLIVSTVIFIGTFIYAVYQAMRSDIDFNTEKTDSCHLQWMRSDTPQFMSNIDALAPLYIAGLFVPLLFILPRRDAIILVTVGLITLIFARRVTKEDESLSSMWCLFAAIYVGAILFIHYLNKKGY